MIRRGVMRPMCHVFVPIIITAIINPALIEAKFERLRDHLICHIISSLGPCEGGSEVAAALC